MKTFYVNWIRTYHKSGTLEIKASSEEEVLAIVDEKIGDAAAETSLDWYPDEDEIEVISAEESSIGVPL